MAEYTNIAPQTVTNRSNVVFTEEPVCGCCCISHREGSGLVNLKGGCECCGKLYKVTFGGNVAIPTGGTAGAISISISLDGEPLASSTATVTPAAVNEYFNVFSSAFVRVPRGCCSTIAVTNVSGVNILVNNANLIVEGVE